jgi:hypothetical protein
MNLIKSYQEKEEILINILTRTSNKTNSGFIIAANQLLIKRIKHKT